MSIQPPFQSPNLGLLGDAPLPACLCVAGPTAAGKTAAALAISHALRLAGRVAEIISVDSALVYRGMDIGTAKPSLAERALVPHHLIDLIDPIDSYSAAAFAQDARRLLVEIHARGHFPLLVGGTMLYFKALFDGLDAMPAADATVRAELAHWAQQEGLSALHRELARVDPVTAQRLAPGDAQRIQRALEVHRISGRALSSFHSERPRTVRPPMLSLEPRERGWLHERIKERLRQMFQGGLIEEVRGLMQRGDLHAALPSMRCVSYRQVWESLRTGNLAGLDEHCIAATRQLAKRQLTWLRQLPERHMVACDDPTALRQTVEWALRESNR